jgi:hypothetical protein
MTIKDGYNPLLEFPVIRQWLYRVLWIAGAAVGLTQAVLSATDTHNDTINKVIAGLLAAIAYLSILSNYTADRNVVVPPKEVADEASSDLQNES